MKKLASLILFSTICFAVFSSSASADVNDFVINNFTAEYVLDNDKIGGSLETTEQIDVTFSDQNHGILRAIPEKYRGYKTKLKILSVERDGQKEPYTTYGENDNKVLKIGDGNKTITGKHSYRIKFYQERIINFDSSPQFYWDVNGTQWQQTFEQVRATVRHKDRPLEAAGSFCYTGVQSSTTRDCIIVQSDGSLISSTNSKLASGENLTLQIPVKTGEFVAPDLKEKIGDNIASIIGLTAGLGLAISAFVIWWKYGRDYRDKGIIIPEYAPPDGLSPAETGLLIDYSVDGRDISATLIDLAVRGYVKLHDDTKKFLFIKNRAYSLELLKNNFSGLKAHETKLLNAIFDTKKIGETVHLNKLNRTTMSAAITEIRTDLNTELTDKYGLFEKKGQKIRTWMYLGGFASLFGLSFGSLGNPGSIAGGIIAGAAFFGFAWAMPRRSRAGVEANEKASGLKLFMNTVEKDRLKMMQSVDRPYAEPSKTVELYEKLLPYAVALGVEKSWSKQFDDILTNTPSWYQGNNTSAFSAGYLASGLSQTTQSFSRSFESSSSSTSSSGGGSSGGGGGGGGGGGW